MLPLTTERLRLREFVADDAPFIVELLNTDSFRRHIGDRGVRTLDDARAYIEDGPRASYARHGHGLCMVERRTDGRALGMCGLIRRPVLEDVDIGFALLDEHAGHGYAREAALAVLDHGRRELGLRRIVAIVNPDNQRSRRLLERLDFAFEMTLRMPNETHDVLLYASRALA